MSILIKKIILLMCLITFNWLFSQEKIEKKSQTIYLDFKSKYVSSHSIGKDTTSASFGIYINGFQSKEKRLKTFEKFKKSKKRDYSLIMPDFSVNFYCFNRKPQRLVCLDSVRYITEEEYSENFSLDSSPIFIIHKLKDGTYLKWEVITMGSE